MKSSVLLTLAMGVLCSAHIVITYPGWRGNNLITNSTFPYGMQWMFPCGGMGTSRNRTYWPTTGGAVAFQPGWFRGHETAMLYVNMGFGTDGPDLGPKNMSFPMVPPFQVLGPTNGPYPGTVCLPQVPLPRNMEVQPGDLATIQVVELAVHGAALYSCVDIEFVEPGDRRVPEVNETNCFNTTELGFAEAYTITTREPVYNGINGDPAAVNHDQSGAETLARMSWAGWLPILAGSVWAML
ncbi:hypothetical protein B0I35DRAFT_100808 [Stachybotrys elegans]|uniref:Copper acquisition factor BIM1-like domain-containing protein n=1 Tax=Stachybotrys elegans TaxID=80388 RepID=A0A8K0WMI0_9HYPO|nr:hypothetical protein B0I35DRAFT_100808 [Stachybotrys elegans]